MKRVFLSFFLLLFPLSLFAQEIVTIRAGVLPIFDVLPIYVAEKKGYFERHGIKVDIIPCASASERDQLVMAKALDLIVNDLISLALFNKEKIHIVGLRYALRAEKDSPQFYILASKKAEIKRPKDLKNVPIGVSEFTVIHYVTERLLEKEGLKREEIRIVPISRIPDRLSALEKGEILAATLPDPFASLAIMQGAIPLLDDRDSPYGGSIFSVRKEFLEKNKKAIRTFLSVIDRAIEDINNDKKSFAPLIIEKKLIPPPLFGSYNLPTFPAPTVPTKNQWDDVLSWLREKKLLKNSIPYNEVFYIFER